MTDLEYARKLRDLIKEIRGDGHVFNGDGEVRIGIYTVYFGYGYDEEEDAPRIYRAIGSGQWREVLDDD